MFLLAVGSDISTLSCYPWQGARRIGFAITRWGLVVINARLAAVIHVISLFSSQAKSRIQLLSPLSYNVLQLGVLVLTAKIISGGIWVHFSWGRFWVWDSKETWALIAPLCYLVPMHGRLVG